MNEPAKTHLEWIDERFTLKQRIRELEQSESELKQMEAELREFEEKYRNILENIEDGYFEVDTAGNFTFFNDSVCRMVGYRTLADSGQALIWTSGPDKKYNYFNQPWLDFTGRTREQEMGDGWAEEVHPEDLARCVETYTKAFDRRERFSMVYRLRRHDGEYRWIQDDGSPRCDSKGIFLGFIGYCLDVTEQVRAHESLRESEERFRLLVQSAPEAIFVQTEGRFAYLNPTALRLFGADSALNEIEKNRGICYDDAVADACLRLFRERGFQLEGT